MVSGSGSVVVVVSGSVVVVVVVVVTTLFPVPDHGTPVESGRAYRGVVLSGN